MTCLSSTTVKYIRGCQLGKLQFWLEANCKVRASGVPNYLGERIPVPSCFNFQFLEDKLQPFSNKKLIQYLKFGFPIEHNGWRVTHNFVNHQGAGPQFYEDIVEYLRTELKAGAVLGPFTSSPFEGQIWGVPP